jgi:uncharacterized protein YjbI with pentapeptide repeats
MKKQRKMLQQGRDGSQSLFSIDKNTWKHKDIDFFQLPIQEEKTYYNKIFENCIFAESEFNNCLFIQCTFIHCDFSEIHFSECEFIGCNFWNIWLISYAIFNKCQFTNCGIRGSEISSRWGVVCFNNCHFSQTYIIDCEINKDTFSGDTIFPRMCYITAYKGYSIKLHYAYNQKKQTEIYYTEIVFNDGSTVTLLSE